METFRPKGLLCSASQSPDSSPYPDPEGIQSVPASISYFKSTNYISYFDKRTFVLLVNQLFHFFKLSFWWWSEVKAIYWNFSFMTFVVITSSERMMFDIIGRHFTANTSVFIIIIITYSHLTYSSIQCSPYIELFMVVSHNIKTDLHK